jgi:hypothetical protein
MLRVCDWQDLTIKYTDRDSTQIPPATASAILVRVQLLVNALQQQECCLHSIPSEGRPISGLSTPFVLTKAAGLIPYVLAANERLRTLYTFS